MVMTCERDHQERNQTKEKNPESLKWIENSIQIPISAAFPTKFQ